MEFRTSLIIALFLLLLAPLEAQPPVQSIRGAVIDNASNAPLSFATVVLLGTDPLVGTTADIDGIFTITDVPVGRYDIEISYVGYESSIILEVIVSSAKATVLNVTMQESATSLDEVVIKPNVSKEISINTMATVSARMLSVEEAQRFAGGFDDPARLAASFSGVASNTGSNAIMIRGNAPKSLQWKMEGVEIPNPNHFADLAAFGGGGLTALSSQMLANSDFFTGAFPAEYNNALSGVFDIFIRNGNNQNHEHTFQVGLTGIDLSSEGPFKKGKNSSYLFNYRYSTLALLEPLLPDNAGAVKYQDLSFKFNFPTKNAGTFTFWGVGLMDESGQKAKTDSTKWEYDSDREEQNVKQYMGVMGMSNTYLLNSKMYIKTTLAATIGGIDLTTERLTKKEVLIPENQITNNNWNFVLSSFLKTKFSARHTNKSGVTFTGLNYNLLLKDVGETGHPLQTIVDEQGFSTLLSAYSNSTFRVANNITMNIGLTGQLFTLNKQYTIEPRVGMKWFLNPKQSFGFAYGLHSRSERLNYYFTTNSLTGNERINKDMDFTKAHHVVLSYDLNIARNLHLKVEPYYQLLYSVPVIADSSYSFINLENDWFFNQKLVNTGKGRNFGLDVTLEKFMTRGYYFLFSGSVFSSKYKGGDDIWRNTRYNRNYLFNFLIGKEWQFGRNDQHVFSANTRLSLQGGDRHSPVDLTASQEMKEAVHDETSAFQEQLPASFNLHLTLSYRLNKEKTTHEIALKILNATAQNDFYGFQYNYQTNGVDKIEQAIILPNLSYKISF